MRCLIRTNGDHVDFHSPIGMNDARQMIGADTLSTVSLHHLGPPLHVMLIDDNAHNIKPLKNVNAEATALYWANCRPGTTHPILGDVLVVPDGDYAQ